MEERCRYCQADVTYDTLVCPKCGSRLVEMEESRRWGPIIAAGLGLVAIGVAVYFFATWSSDVANTSPPPSKPKKDASAVQIAQDDERNRQAVDDANRKWREDQERLATSQAEQAAWDGKSAPEREKHVAAQLDALKKKVEQLKQAQDPKTLEALAAVEPHLDSAAAFLKAGSLEVAFESVKTIRELLRDLEKSADKKPVPGTPVVEKPAAEKPATEKPEGTPVP